jgi:NADH-ubiquinone oxidoreductase chain 2
MIFISILILIVVKALPSINKNLSTIYFSRISAIIFVYAGVLSLNTYYIQSIGSGIGIYSGLFQVTQVSALIESFLLIIGSLILVSWPSINHYIKSPLQQSSPAANAAGHKQTLTAGNILNISAPSAAALIGPKFRERGEADQLSNNLSAGQKYSSQLRSRDYSLIVLFSSLGSCLLISSYDLISLYISIELQSFGLYVLATLYRESETSTKAGLKYFLLGGLSSCIILLGCGIIYSYTGLTNFESIYSVISTSNSVIFFRGSGNILTTELANLLLPAVAGGYVLQGLSLGLILIFIGFLFKIAAAPLHNWSPDVYDEVPTIVTTWLTIIPKISILVLLLELQYYGCPPAAVALHQAVGGDISPSEAITAYAAASEASLAAGLHWPSITAGSNFRFAAAGQILKNILLISSLLSLIIGTVVGLAQSRIKRLLAYSTISHIGFILLALAINSDPLCGAAIDSLIFYIIQYTITNLNIFLTIIALSYVTAYNATPIFRGNKIDAADAEIKDIRYISELKGQFFSNPILSISLAICLFSMAGVPPLIGFFSKQFVLYSALQNGYYFISIIAILVSVISASYYLKIVKVIYTDADQPVQAAERLSAPENPATGSQPRKSGSDLSAAAGLIIENGSACLSNAHSYLISVLTLSILLYILKPSLILNSTQLLSLSLFNS